LLLERAHRHPNSASSWGEQRAKVDHLEGGGSYGFENLLAFTRQELNARWAVLSDDHGAYLEIARRLARRAQPNASNRLA
jgi:hypothetical protein